MKRNQKFIFLLVLIGLILSFGCKTAEEEIDEIIYDIRGTWKFHEVLFGTDKNVFGGENNYSNTFSGGVNNGTITSDAPSCVGTYTVNGINVNINVTQYWSAYYTFEWSYQGQFTDLDHLVGNVSVISNHGHSAEGNWDAERQ